MAQVTRLLTSRKRVVPLFSRFGLLCGSDDRERDMSQHRKQVVLEIEEKPKFAYLALTYTPYLNTLLCELTCVCSSFV